MSEKVIYCSNKEKFPEGMVSTVECPLCSKRTVVFGLGTQRVEEELARLHPRIAAEGAMARVDSDALHTSEDFHDPLEFVHTFQRPRGVQWYEGLEFRFFRRRRRLR